MRKIAIVSAVAAIALATPALAAGAYVGVGVTHDNVGGTSSMEALGFDGIGGTIFAGYDFKVSDGVFAGVEANFDLASAKMTAVAVAEDTDPNNVTTTTSTTTGVKFKHAFGASARLGYNLNSSTALYGRVGYQRGRVEASTLEVESPDTTGTPEVTRKSYDGLRLGAGLQTSLTEQLSLRVEYNRTHYYLSSAEKKNLDAGQKGGYKNNQFSIGVAYGF